MKDEQKNIARLSRKNADVIKNDQGIGEKLHCSIDINKLYILAEFHGD